MHFHFLEWVCYIVLPVLAKSLHNCLSGIQNKYIYSLYYISDYGMRYNWHKSILDTTRQNTLIQKPSKLSRTKFSAYTWNKIVVVVKRVKVRPTHPFVFRLCNVRKSNASLLLIYDSKWIMLQLWTNNNLKRAFSQKILTLDENNIHISLLLVL